MSKGGAETESMHLFVQFERRALECVDQESVLIILSTANSMRRLVQASSQLNSAFHPIIHNRNPKPVDLVL